MVISWFQPQSQQIGGFGSPPRWKRVPCRWCSCGNPTNSLASGGKPAPVGWAGSRLFFIGQAVSSRLYFGECTWMYHAVLVNVGHVSSKREDATLCKHLHWWKDLPVWSTIFHHFSSFFILYPQVGFHRPEVFRPPQVGIRFRERSRARWLLIFGFCQVSREKRAPETVLVYNWYNKLYIIGIYGTYMIYVYTYMIYIYMIYISIYIMNSSWYIYGWPFPHLWLEFTLGFSSRLTQKRRRTSVIDQLLAAFSGLEISSFPSVVRHGTRPGKPLQFANLNMAIEIIEIVDLCWFTHFHSMVIFQFVMLVS